MEEKFKEILADLFGSDVSYHLKSDDVKLVLQGMGRAFEMGKLQVYRGGFGIRLSKT